MNALKVFAASLGLTVLVDFSPKTYAIEANGIISLIDSVKVPAETSGILLEISAKEGAQVTAGQLLAKVDSSKSEILRRVADLELAIQQKAADNDVKIRASKSQAAVAAAEYDESVAINNEVSQAIPQLKVRRLQLSAEHARLEVEVAEIESEVDHLRQQLKQAELEASDRELSRCELRASLNGVIVERYKHAGEWVTPGESVMRIVRMDQLRLEWLLKVDEAPPHLAEGREVTAEVKLSEGQTHRLRGKITYVSPVVEPTDEYRVWCDFDNPVDASGRWLLRAGLEATIRLDDADSATAETTSES